MNGIEIEDFPDLTHWKHVEEFTLEDAALLLAGVDPLENNLSNVRGTDHPRWKKAYGYMKALESAVRQGTITLTKCIGFIEHDNFNGYTVEYKDIKQSNRDIKLSRDQSIVTRSALQGWVNREKIQYVRPLKKIEPPTQEYIAKPEQTTSQPLQLPYYGHKSEGLEYANETIKQFWSTYDETDPNTAPTQKEIIEYLKKQGATKNMADAVNLVVRPRNIPRRTRNKK